MCWSTESCTLVAEHSHDVDCTGPRYCLASFLCPRLAMPPTGAALRLRLSVMKAKYLQKKGYLREHYNKLQKLRLRRTWMTRTKIAHHPESMGDGDVLCAPFVPSQSCDICVLTWWSIIQLHINMYAQGPSKQSSFCLCMTTQLHPRTWPGTCCRRVRSCYGKRYSLLCLATSTASTSRFDWCSVQLDLPTSPWSVSERCCMFGEFGIYTIRIPLQTWSWGKWSWDMLKLLAWHNVCRNRRLHITILV